MKLRFSEPRGIPYIEFDGGRSRIIFSSATKENNRYKYLIWNIDCRYSQSVGKGKKKVEVHNNENFITDMNITGIPREAKSNPLLNNGNIKKIRDIFKRYSENGLVSDEKVVKIGEEIERTFL